MDFSEFFTPVKGRAKVSTSKHKVLGGPWETDVKGLSVALIETEDGTPVLQPRMDGTAADRFVKWITPRNAAVYAACLAAYLQNRK